MNREGKKCVLYPRVSTEMQVDGYSLEGQKNGLKRFADREEMEIVGIYEDAGKSGKSIEGRPAFKKMLSDIKNGLEIDYILVYKLSRFGRNAADILNSLEFVQSYGINLICIEEGIDSSQTSGKLLISVLSAVAEIERENIIEQTMNGRREKARQGGWNGGFAPYGYYLKDNQLLIEETEAEAIRIIFDKFANSDIGLGGVAKYLNLQGIKKIPRQNGTLETWSSHFIRLILDNPVYCGKIAYGRRTREKVKGTKNEYKQVHAEDYILEDGQHEGIISEELWQKVHAKRMATGIKQPSKIGKDRSHLLTGILKCPLCGSSMYTNKHAWTNKDGTYKEVYYYICGRNKQERGHHCDYKASLRKTDIEPLVIEAVKELVSDKYFAKEIEKRIGVQIDTREVTHIRVSRNGKLLLIGDFINPIIKLWDFAVYPLNCIGQKLGKWYILTGFTNRLKSTKACAFHLYFAQHHFGVFDKISVHRNIFSVRIKVYPVWLYIHHSVTLLQDKNIARDLRACVCLKGVVWQTDST